MQAVILAAGSSSRFRPLSDNRHKSLFQVAGDSLIGHTISTLEETPVTSCIIVQGEQRQIEEEIDEDDRDLDIEFVVQKDPQGMGHALEQCRDRLEDAFIVMNPYRLKADAYLPYMIERYEQNDVSGVLLGRTTSDPQDYGVMAIDDDDTVTEIVEKPAEGEEPSNIRVIGIYLLEPSIFEHRDKVPDHEYDFEAALDRYVDSNDVAAVTTNTKTVSIKYPWDLFSVASYLTRNQPPKAIGDDVEIADSATIIGPVVIEDGTTIYENAVIRGPCYIGHNCTIGNNCLIRSGSSLADEVVIGANSEIRGSIIEEKTHVHDAFIGDTIIGRNTRIGAGTVFANRSTRNEQGGRDEITVTLPRDGTEQNTARHRLGGIVGDTVDIGTQANIMPGVMIGSGSTVGPSTCLLNNVDRNTKIYTRFEYTKRDLDG